MEGFRQTDVGRDYEKTDRNHIGSYLDNII